jgi:hypothetical protein
VSSLKLFGGWSDGAMSIRIPSLEVSVGRIHPLRLILIGFFLVLFGFVGPLLMVLGILETSFALSFLSHGASVGGLFLGLIGTAMYVGTRRK